MICVSIIIPAYNAAATIGRTLSALSKQNCFQPFEMIVVDDGSTDGTKEIVATFPTVKYIRQDNAGPAAARNHGAKVALGEYLAFTDSDCIPHEDWVSQLMSGFGQQQVGVVAGSYGIANPQSVLARCICSEILWRHTHLMPDFPNAFGSYNFCVRKNVFDAVGRFNTGYRRASGEDNDLSYKVTRSGWRIYFQRQALVDHFHPSGVFKYLKEPCRHGFWRVKMYKDHPRMIQGDGYTFWKDMVEIPGAAFFLLLVMLNLFYLGKLNVICSLFLILFLLLEVFFAMVITQNLFEGIFFGGVLLMRSFARLGGFSTGLLYLIKK